MRWRRLWFDSEVMRLMGMTALVKPVGLLTQALLANYFGAGIRLDAFAFALFLVEFLDQTMGAVFRAVVVPLTIKLKRIMNPQQLFRFQNAIYPIFILPVLLYMGFLVVRGGLVVDWLGPSLPPETKAYIVNMLKIMALPGVALLVVTMLKATLNLNRKFRLVGTMPLLNGVVMLGTLVLFHERLGIWVLPVGFAISNLGQLLWLGIHARATRCMVPMRPSLPPGMVAQLWSLSWMVLVAHIFLTVNKFIDKMFAASLEPGSISSINYAMTIMNFGVQLFTLSLVAIMFTRMSEFFARGDMGAGSGYIHNNLKHVTRIVMPVSLALCVASGEIVRVLFQHGAFDAADTQRTAGALAMYLLGLPAVIINAIVGRIYHSLQRLRDRMWLAAQFLLTNALGNFLLVKSLQVVGLAISSTVAVNLHLILGLVVLQRYRIGLAAGSFLAIVVRAYVLTTITFLVYWLSGFGTLMSEWEIGVTLYGAVLVAACRFCFIIAVYVAGLLIWRWLEKRR